MRETSESTMAIARQVMRGTAAVVIGIIAPSVASAQPKLNPDPVAPFTNFYLTTGTLLMNVTRLNAHFTREDLLAANRPGFFSLSNDGYSVGIGGYGPISGKFVGGGEYHQADMGQETSPTGKTNQITTKYWMATAGYAAYTSWRFSFIPYLGIGMGTATLTLKNRSGGATVPDTQDPTFDEVIASPGSKSQMIGSYVMVQPGVAFDFILLKDDATTWGITLGVRFGTAITPNRTTWKYGSREVFGGPDLGPTGRTIRVILGIGGFRLADAKPPR